MMKFIIERKVLIAMIFTAVSMLGYFSYKQLAVELYPNAQLPFLFVFVSTNAEVDPKYMETQAIIPLEGAIGALKGVEKIESQADVQQGRIRISFQQSVNIKYAYLKLNAKVDEIKKTLPKEFQVQVIKFDINQINNDFITLKVLGSGGIDRVRQIVDKEITNKLKNINGISNTSVFGGREKSIDIILHDDVCKANNITASDIRNILAQNNTPRTFAGKITHKNQLVFVNVISEYTELKELQELILNQKNNIKLKDVADIRFGEKEQESYSRINGKESVTIQLTRDVQSNQIELAGRVIEQIKILNKTLHGKDIELVVESNSAETMETNLNQITHQAIIGGILAIFILWIFLRNFRLVAAIALAIPISIFSAYNFFYYFGISINSLTLIGLAMAIGMLLDNSVVVMENIYRLAARKTDIETAVIQGTKEVWRSVVAATLCIVMVFLPFAFSKNFAIGLVGKNIGVSIISTLIISLIVALILVPMITHAFLKIRTNKKPIKFENISYHNRLVQIYIVLLKTCMRNSGATIIGILGVFFLTILIGLFFSFSTNTEPEVTNFNYYVTMRGGTTLNNTDKIVADVENRLKDIKEIKELVSQIYEGESVLTITLQKDFKNIRNYSLSKVKQEIWAKTENLQENSHIASFSFTAPITAAHFGGGGSGGSNENSGGNIDQLLGLGSKPERIVIKGSNFDEILTQANTVRYQLSKLSSVQWANVSVPSGSPQIFMEFDKPTMSLFDIPANSVLSELNTFPKEFSSGVVFKQGTDEYGIQIKSLSVEKQKVRNLKDLKTLPVKNSTGSSFELQHIANFNFGTSTSIIKRINQEKQLEVQFDYQSDIKEEDELLEASRLEVKNVLAQISQPAGIAVEHLEQETNLGDFKFLIFAALLLIYMILASIFESLATPLVLMFAIPLAAIGSIIALILTNNSLFSIFSLTGFIILIGIVVNNGIILLDYSRVLEKRGYQPFRALMMSGLARIRPILITTITTVIALLPLAMGKGEYSAKIGSPFAITVIGGLSLSTLLTLIFIPTQYSGTRAALKWIGSQKIWVKLVQLTILISGVLFIYFQIDALLWKTIDYILLIVLTPASFYFVQNSLRKASENLINDNEPLKINIRSLVKIYDRDSKFVREWKSGLNIRKRLGFERTYESINDFDYLVWKLPILMFLVYFVYIFLENEFWYFLLPVLIYLLLISIVTPFKQLGSAFKATGKNWPLKLTNIIYKLIFWTFPIISLCAFYNKYKLLGLIIPTSLIWYFILLIKTTSDRLYKENINIMRLTGRFKNLRKGFYKFVMIIPIIGKKKTPFKALKAVSFTIENGMFGLLGPNGAGKSTLMRIICGILEPSYGQITINGIDVKEKREELQGLIGYLPQEFGMYENLTAWEFLNYMGILKKIYVQKLREERITYVLQAVHMFEQKDNKIGSFSGGMKQRIGIAQILLHLPRILVVDEPTAGLDPRERIRFRNLLVELSKDRIVIFSTHIIEDVASSCNRVAVVKKGSLEYLGEPVNMAYLADGKVWSIDMTMEDFETFKDSHVIIHHMRDGNIIRVRCIAEDSPFEGAVSIKANLEDAYLYLLSKK